MKQSLISRLSCPARRSDAVCAGELGIAETPAPAWNTKRTELTEGVLECSNCDSVYPVIAGVLILLPDTWSWLRANYYYVLAGAARTSGIGEAMLDWLEDRDWHLGNRFNVNYYEEHRWINMFTATHYDPRPAGSDDLSPLGRFLGSQPQVFEVVNEMLAEHIREPVNHALDAGTNVGGMARRLADYANDVIGIDNAYNPILAARRIQFGSPVAERSYRCYMDGRHHELHPLPDEIMNTEFLVASCYALPVSGPYELITALNLVDSVQAPEDLLRQLVDQLTPSGLLLITSPYSWTSDDVPVENWIGASPDKSSSDAMLQTMQGLGLEILEARDHVPWVLREHQRWYRTFLNHCVLARRKH